MMDQNYTRPTGFLKVLLCAFLMVFVCTYVLVNWNAIKAYIPTSDPITVFATATAGTAPQDKPRPTMPPYHPPRTAPLPAQNPGGTFNDQAAADAAFATAVAEGEYRAAPVQNVDILPADAPPVEYGSRTNERQPAGDNVPTAEPLPQVTDAFGSKEKPINIQETHQCKHGQVWSDVTPKGCHAPKP